MFVVAGGIVIEDGAEDVGTKDALGPSSLTPIGALSRQTRRNDAARLTVPSRRKGTGSRPLSDCPDLMSRACHGIESLLRLAPHQRPMDEVR